MERAWEAGGAPRTCSVTWSPKDGQASSVEVGSFCVDMGNAVKVSGSHFTKGQSAPKFI